MDDMIKKILDKAQLNLPATREILAEVESKLEIQFPDQYISFMLESNGVEGTVGNNSYVAIWTAEQLVILNEEYAVNEFTPGLVYFGSDGAGMAYAFDKRVGNMPIVEFPLKSINIEDAKHCGNTFMNFLQGLFDEK